MSIMAAVSSMIEFATSIKAKFRKRLDLYRTPTTITGAENVCERLTLKKAVIEKTDLWKSIFEYMEKEAMRISEKNYRTWYKPMGAIERYLSVREPKNMNPIRTKLGDDIRIELVDGTLAFIPDIQQYYILHGGAGQQNKFWNMVWEQNSSVIVMLDSEDLKATYFPHNENETVKFQKYEITCTDMISESFCEVRNLTVSLLTEKGNYRHIKHIRYNGFKSLSRFRPDREFFPDHDHFGKFIDYLSENEVLHTAMPSNFFPYKIEKFDHSPPSFAPVIQANIKFGRSGCLVVIDAISRLLKRNIKHEYNIEKIILNMKIECFNSIQTPDEYKFIVNQVIHMTEKMKLKFPAVDAGITDSETIEVAPPKPTPPEKEVQLINPTKENFEKIMSAKEWTSEKFFRPIERKFGWKTEERELQSWRYDGVVNHSIIEKFNAHYRLLPRKSKFPWLY
ncbi:hypothetical protein GCK72_025009 [Caenorhabditis remanei]|uniref:protein-tyrosine-phosphatase n=1 Tax=Caenorhabditis remanei TaxID=31234 RepID=A0A6A5G1J8_CAERE|nr:hypothetical protein GCK72_025009 [Caenorhabditis remanei]KAF1748542.1 hypothetical protein GCK72_025009 [Caenorhabditis remanei]